ncbi:uncharacterized protein N7483_009144 [Penicillium malachiteum]|uniref:uncharacterized protein n=1 Tax=Penicillium malachiteum TaxID=1324776 RepID=UPI0025475526|nr:uncharacterized protein N7483_009144 [Penicillium malachiteum]KAJ5721210.1 hypothetical protein N7483_009144 [Penicillium malachiteum]
MESNFIFQSEQRVFQAMDEKRVEIPSTALNTINVNTSEAKTQKEIAGGVLVMHLIFMIVAFSIAYSEEANNGQFEILELYKGSCSTTDNWTTALHLLINFSSTLILGASSSMMQVIGAPSRTAVDRAHNKHKWLDIGTLSIRNFGAMDWKRRTLWLCLLFTSLPIHMLYNSIIFRTISTSDFGTVLIPEDLGRDEPLVYNEVEASSFYNVIGAHAGDIQKEIFNSTFINATLAECVRKYDTSFNTKYGTLLLAADRKHFSNASSLEGDSGNVKDSDDGENYDYTASQAAILQEINEGVWRVRGDFWSYREWNFTTSNGSIFTFGRGQPGIGINAYFQTTSPTVKQDIITLRTYMNQHNPTSAALQTFLDNSTNWADSSWAGNLTYRFAGYTHAPYFLLEMLPKSCMFKEATEKCQLSFSPPIALIVLSCSIIKLACMVLATWHKREEPLLTIGDSIASFLSEPDPTTKGRCMMSRPDTEAWSLAYVRSRLAGLVSCFPGRSKDTQDASDILLTKPGTAEASGNGIGHLTLLSPKKLRWHRAASRMRMGLTYTFLLLCDMGLFIVLFFSIATAATGFDSVKAALSGIWSMGFGSANTNTLITINLSHNMIALILLANVPQLVLSIQYYLINSMLTCMLVAAEWDAYALHRKHLRVSNPHGEQRSTYYLSLPFRYSVPKLTLFTLAHWMVSQSLFFVNIVGYDVHGQEDKLTSTRGVCYSPLAIFIFFLLLSGCYIVCIVLCRKTFKSHAPVVGHCSAAISASCHPPAEDVDAALKPVMWGGDSP